MSATTTAAAAAAPAAPPAPAGRLQLYIGNKNYSSWSLRPWILMKHLGIDCEEANVEVAGRGVDLALHGKYSPSGLVPVLHVDAETTVWDSLAIAEYANELAGGRAWPADAKARAHARCVTAEMHSGFPDLRAAMPMNIKMRLVGKPAGEVSEKVKSQLERITAIFTRAPVPLRRLLGG